MDLAQRRIGFYERLGFRLNPFEHVQPPLQKGHPELPLKIMSYPQTLTGEEFALLKEILYTRVYKTSKSGGVRCTGIKASKTIALTGNVSRIHPD